MPLRVIATCDRCGFAGIYEPSDDVTGIGSDATIAEFMGRYHWLRWRFSAQFGRDVWTRWICSSCAEEWEQIARAQEEKRLAFSEPVDATRDAAAPCESTKTARL